MSKHVARHAWIWLFACGVSLLPLHAAHAAGTTTCALVMENAAGANGALADLVQAKAAAIPQTRWVERVQVDRVLSEQQLAAALGAENVRERVRVGRLLKADVLVLLRPRETPDGKLLDVTIAETNQGLRLLGTTIPRPARADAAADAVARLVERSLAKSRETVIEVCAVPPMISKDLGYEFDHLKTAYADLIEQMLSSQPGVLVVELAEANALAKELTLTSAGPVKRPLPLYFLGEYRNDGKGEARRVTISLKLNRGDSPVDSAELKSLTPSEAPARVRETAAALMKQAGKVAIVPADPAHEVQAMRERIAEYERIGQWTEAFDMIEAALLLNPEQPDLRYKTLEIIGRIDWQGWLRNRYANNAVLAAYGRRALAHFDDLQRGMNDVQRLERFAQLKRQLPGMAVMFRGDPPPGELEAFEVEVGRYAAGIVKERLARGSDIRPLVEMIEGMYCGRTVLAEFINETRGPALDALRRGEFTPTRNGSFMQHHVQLIELLSKSTHADVRDAAAGALAFLKAAATQPVEVSNYRWKPAPEANGDAVNLRRLTISELDIDGKPRRFPMNVQDWMPAGAGVDVVWDYATINLMNHPGELRCVFAEKEKLLGRGMVDVRIADVKFDGRYVWVTTTRDDPLVLVIEPASGRVHRMGASHGLPPMRLASRAAPIAPGNAVLVGQESQSWIGLATFDAARGFTFKVIHEAIEEGPVDPKDPSSIRAAFTPRFACALGIDSGSPSGLVVVGRLKSQDKEVSRRPLLVDIAKQTVRPMDEGLVYREGSTRLTPFRGEVFWSCLEPATPHLLKIAADGTIKTVTENFPEGDVIFHGDRMIVAPTDNLRELFAGKPRGKAWPQQWWLSEGLGKPLRPVWPTIADGMEMRRVTLRNSAVYGLIALTVPAKGNGGTNVFYQADLPPATPTAPSN